MRTTVTLEADVAALLERRMDEQGLSFKQVINQTLREALTTPGERASYRLRPRGMGRPDASLTRSVALAAELEDEEIRHKLSLRK